MFLIALLLFETYSVPLLTAAQDKTVLEHEPKEIKELEEEDLDTEIEESNTGESEEETVIEEDVELPDGFDILDDSNVQFENLTEEDEIVTNEDGILFINGKVLLVVGDKPNSLPPVLDKLMIEGVQGEIKTGEVKLGDKLSSLMDNIFQPMTVSANNAPTIQRVRSARYGQSQVGVYRVNGQIAFCIEHRAPAPSTGTSYGPLLSYENARIQKALYYGWGGPESVFNANEEDLGIVVTSLILSRIYNPNDPVTGTSLPKYETLWDKVQNGRVPNHSVRVSRNEMTVSVTDGVQKSQWNTFQADENNSITVRLPNNVTGIKEGNRGQEVRFTGRSMEIKGNERFRFEAPLTYNTTLESGELSGTMRNFQPMIVKSSSGHYQDIGLGQWITDPTATVSFSVPFERRTVTMTVNHVDKDMNTRFKQETSTVTIGNNYEACPLNGETNRNVVMIPLDGCDKGKVPTSNFTITLNYSSQWDVNVVYYDRLNDKDLQSFKLGTYMVGSRYSHTAPDQIDIRNQTTEYDVYRNATRSGTMGRGNVTLRIPYTPYHKAKVTYQNRFPQFDIFDTLEERYRVGASYDFTQPLTFENGDLVYDRENSSRFRGTMDYADVSHTFYYKLRRTIEVNYLDERTGEVLQPQKSYEVHQGDDYLERNPTIRGKGYTYRYVRSDGDSDRGTIETDNIEINYYYDVPLVKLGLEKIQIYTAPSNEGLPVKVFLNKDYNYNTDIEDMDDPNKTIAIALYMGNTKLDSKTFKAKDIPDNLDFKILPNVLTVNESKPYTVKIEEYNEDDFDVINNADSLTTDGYTSSELTLQFNAGESHQVEYEAVVMTEREVEREMVEFYESLTIPIEELEPMRTGYGFSMPLDVSYDNEIGTNNTNFSFNMKVPTDIVDESFIPYQTSQNVAHVPLEQTSENTSTVSDHTVSNQKFELQNVNVEKKTGHLFSDSQVASNDSRIQHDLVFGDRKFYLPIWSFVGGYDIDVHSTTDIGVHKINVIMSHDLEIFAHMYTHMDSDSIENDAILLQPVNVENPFPNGIPPSWTEKDVKDFYEMIDDDLSTGTKTGFK
ncbi:hypothetical protein BTS2_3364 [Bacillus sp. TS-2]|nr:hypothetical protein BTS2_3364 [Bacillus sp. TS-2]